jgi:endoglucanase
MERRQFIKSTAAAGVMGMLNRGIPSVRTSPFNVTFNNLPLWRGFNLQEKFTHKPDEWLRVAPEWGFKNEPFRESDFDAIRELGFNFVRLPMSYKCCVMRITGSIFRRNI